MTSEQIKSLNLMACSSPTGHHEFMFNGEMITLSVVKLYDPITNRGHWTLTYPSYISDLYSHKDIPPYDKGVLRYMYNEYMTYYDKLLSNNRAI